jgi:hypothetical protein
MYSALSKTIEQLQQKVSVKNVKNITTIDRFCTAKK